MIARSVRLEARAGALPASSTAVAPTAASRSNSARVEPTRAASVPATAPSVSTSPRVISCMPTSSGPDEAGAVERGDGLGRGERPVRGCGRRLEPGDVADPRRVARLDRDDARGRGERARGEVRALPVVGPHGEVLERGGGAGEGLRAPGRVAEVRARGRAGGAPQRLLDQCDVLALVAGHGLGEL